MTAEKHIENEYTLIFTNLYYSSIEKGIDERGWYSNERNGKWLPVSPHQMNLLEFKNDNTELRPITLRYIDNNNGWIRLGIDSVFPPSGDKFITYDGIKMNMKPITRKTMWALHKKNLITHYKPVRRELPPLD